MQVCNEMLTSPDSINLTLWVKILNQLELLKGDEITNKELLVLTGQILDVSVSDFSVYVIHMQDILRSDIL